MEPFWLSAVTQERYSRTPTHKLIFGGSTQYHQLNKEIGLSFFFSLSLSFFSQITM